MMPWAKDYYLALYTFEASVSGPQNRKKVAEVPIDAAFYMHSFGLTANYAVLPFNLVMGGVGPMHQATLLGKFQENFKGVHIVDFATGGVQVFDDMPAFQHTHIANTYENASGIVFDVGAGEHTGFQKNAVMDRKLFLDKKVRDVKTMVGGLVRYHFNNITKATTVEPLTHNGRAHDFYKINPAFNGLPYCVYYAVQWFHDDKAYASMAVMKHDVCQDKISYWSQLDTYVNEPFFIAAQSGAEDDGTLVFTALDGTTGKAIFVALDAKSFTELERIQLPNHIPFLAHGSFMPSSTVAETVII
jgi:carotenoid cleavage dioxygenase-like enzyme